MPRQRRRDAMTADFAESWMSCEQSSTRSSWKSARSSAARPATSWNGPSPSARSPGCGDWRTA
eukprot:2934248-Heterocapsa_arctica.AAC.1